MATLPIECHTLAPLERRCRFDRAPREPAATASEMFSAQVYPLGCDLGESPIWCEEERAIYLVDITRQRLHQVRLVDGRCITYQLPGRATACTRSGTERLLLAVATRLAELDTRTGEWLDLAPLEACPPAGCIFNDGKPDRAGRWWIGTRDPGGASGRGSVYCLVSLQSARCAATGLTGTNGMAWNPSGDILYVADSRARVIFRYTFDTPGGTVTEKSVFVGPSPDGAAPDGLTVDRDNHVWCAFWGGARVERIAPDGKRDATLHLPVAHPTSCTFGGDRLATLFVTTARSPTKYLGTEPATEGHLFAFHTHFAGIPDLVPQDLNRQPTNRKQEA